MEAFVQALLIWIAVNSGYTIENIPLPVIKFVTPQQITAEYYGDRPDLIPEGRIDDRIWALYDATYPKHGAVYLRIDSVDEVTNENLNLSTNTTLVSLSEDVEGSADSIGSSQLLSIAAAGAIKKRSWQVELLENDPILTERLLHELVHHVQYQTGEIHKYQCSAQGEKAAYQIGGRYFKQNFLEDPLPNRNFWAHIYSRC